MSTIRVTPADLRQAARGSRGAESPLAPGADETPGCAVPTASGGNCTEPGVLADPQTGRYRCLYHVHALGEIA